jgi:hypothetical protein
MVAPQRLTTARSYKALVAGHGTDACDLFAIMAEPYGC